MHSTRSDRGLCGRVAHHSLRGRTQTAIALQHARDGIVYEIDLSTLAEPELWCRSGAW